MGLRANASMNPGARLKLAFEAPAAGEAASIEVVDPKPGVQLTLHNDETIPVDKIVLTVDVLTSPAPVGP